jgi:hypothetical protein
MSPMWTARLRYIGPVRAPTLRFSTSLSHYPRILSKNVIEAGLRGILPNSTERGRHCDPGFRRTTPKPGVIWYCYRHQLKKRQAFLHLHPASHVGHETWRRENTVMESDAMLVIT